MQYHRDFETIWQTMRLFWISVFPVNQNSQQEIFTIWWSITQSHMRDLVHTACIVKLGRFISTSATREACNFIMTVIVQKWITTNNLRGETSEKRKSISLALIYEKSSMNSFNSHMQYMNGFVINYFRNLVHDVYENQDWLTCAIDWLF